MIRVAILIASHISYDGQLQLLDKCLTSLLNQTQLPESIYLSISFDNQMYQNEFKNILQKYGRYTSNPKITFKISRKQLYQMEHLYNIVSNIDNKYDMFMFCDDDDTYHINRVKTFVEGFNYGKNIHSNNFGGYKETSLWTNPRSRLFQNVHAKLTTPEYWAYGIVPNIIIEFFTNYKGENFRILQNSLADMVFRHYLIKSEKYFNWISENNTEPLYNYNLKNPNSICGKRERGIGNKVDSILYGYLLDCNNNTDLEYMIDDMEIYCKELITKELIDDIKYRYNLHQLTY